MTASDWIVHKFGGSSVADAECFRRVADILEGQPPASLGVVLSACRGVTDTLLGLVALAEAQDATYAARLKELRARHVTIAEALLRPATAAGYVTALDADLKDIEGVLNSVRLIRSAAQNVRDLIAGFGEIWSTRLFTEFLRERGKRPGEVRWLDARRVVIVEWGPLGPSVDWDASQSNFDSVIGKDFAGTLVITGFIASNRSGIQTTLGRNGSDFSASIFGALCHAREIQIWTDSNLHPQHLCIGQARDAHLCRTGFEAQGEGHHEHRPHRARESGRRGHDRRAGNSASAVRRTAR
jgi:aspartokinase/homoserine dehydrogenase 1